jgi:hypothetical protein
MCGRFAFFASGEDLAAHFDLDQVPTLEPRYNIAPTQMVAIVRIPGGGHGRELVFTRWGLIPHWARDPGIGNRSINARAETVALKPSLLDSRQWVLRMANHPGGKTAHPFPPAGGRFVCFCRPVGLLAENQERGYRIVYHPDHPGQ